MFFLFRPADPVSPRDRGRSEYFDCSDCGTGLFDFLFSLFRWYDFASPPVAKVVTLLRFSANPSTHSRPVSPFQVIWRWFSLTFSCPVRTDSLSFPFFLAFLVGFVVSPFRGVGVGFEEPHLRHMF